MARKRPEHASLYDFRDLDIMLHLRENTNGTGVLTNELAEMMGFDVEQTTGRPVGMRLAWMRKYGMVAYDENEHTWKLSRSGDRVVDAQLLAPQLKVVEKMPDELMVDVMAHVTSRFHRGESMLGHMLRREFLYGTKRR